MVHHHGPTCKHQTWWTTIQRFINNDNCEKQVLNLTVTEKDQACYLFETTTGNDYSSSTTNRLLMTGYNQSVMTDQKKERKIFILIYI